MRCDGATFFVMHCELWATAHFSYIILKTLSVAELRELYVAWFVNEVQFWKHNEHVHT